MRLLKQMIVRHLQIYEQGILNNRHYFQNFYIAFGLAYAYLQMKGKIVHNPKEIALRNLVWKQINSVLLQESIYSASNPEEAKRIYFTKTERLIRDFQSLIHDDYAIINKFLDLYDEIKSEDSEEGELYKEGTIGIISYEVPDDI